MCWCCIGIGWMCLGYTDCVDVLLIECAEIVLDEGVDVVFDEF